MVRKIKKKKKAHCYVRHHLFLFVSLSPFPSPSPCSACCAYLVPERRKRRWRMRPTNSGGFHLLPPSLSPPSRIPSSESHHALASMFPVELQEDEGERHCVPCNTHPAKFTPSPPPSPPPPTSFPLFTYTFFPTSYSLLLLIVFISAFLSVTFPKFSLLFTFKCILLSVHLCVYTASHGVSCIGSPLRFAHSAVLRAQMPRGQTVTDGGIAGREV